jgi:acetolactate decarboxylase
MKITKCLKPIVFSSFLALFSQISFAENANTLFQVSTIGALAQAVYDGDFTYGQLFTKGNQGLGTFIAIDGEMVAVDNVYYQIQANGHLRKVQPTQIVPFAEVINFQATQQYVLTNINSYDSLMTELTDHFSNKNLPVAIRIDGQFKHLQLRSLRKQHKPYPSLAQAAKDQAIFDLNNVHGTIVGFWFPQYWAGIAVPGFHLHFVNDDRTIGGHVLDLNIVTAKAAMASANNFAINLPKTASFAAADLNPEALREDIKSAEGGMK